VETIAIEVKNVSKSFKLPHEKHGSLKNIFVNILKSKRGYEKQRVLQDISFSVKTGEFFGIVGKNGSGKSTLLKLLAGIYSPNTGSIQVNGQLTPFIELGVGFNPDLTGRENVYLNGALLGFSRAEVGKMYKEIVEFAELSKFMDQKLKNYSSGMQVRLAFSIAIRANSKILLIDEVLAVGDAAFQQKCFDVFAELKNRGTTIILVTHDMNSVLRFCDRAMLINKGDLVAIGKPTKIADEYLELNYESAEDNKADNKSKNDVTKPKITGLKLSNKEGKAEHKFKPGHEIYAEIFYKNENKTPTQFGFQIFNEAGVYCFGTNSKVAGLEPLLKNTGSIKMNFKANLTPGTYFITVASMNSNSTVVYNYKAKIADFRITKETRYEGVALLPHSWRV
jgi:ABC-2 type transport system ATP-binding protein